MEAWSCHLGYTVQSALTVPKNTSHKHEYLKKGFCGVPCLALPWVTVNTVFTRLGPSCLAHTK